MGKINLHKPTHMSDCEAKIEYDANDIVGIKSVVGNDNCLGTNFYIKGLPEKQFCLETANNLKKLIQENKTEESFSIIQSGIGNVMTVGNENQAYAGGKEGGWAISGWWITLIGTLIGVAALTMAICAL